MVTSEIHLEFDITNKRYRVVDTTDYLSLYGMNVSALLMKLLGTVSFNGIADQQHDTVLDPFIDLQAGDTVSGWYDLPLDDNGDVVNGTWTGTFSIRVANNTLQFSTITPPNTIVTDGSAWLYDFLESGDSITLTAGTPQDVVVASVADGDPNVTITTSTTILSETHDALSIDLTHSTGSLTHTYNGCDEIAATASLSYDCDSGDNGTFTYEDTTPYAASEYTLVSRSATITPPAYAVSAGIAPVTTTASSYTFIQLATLTWELSLTDVLSYTQSDGLVVSYTTSLVKEAKVTCAGTLCGLNPCIDSLRQAHHDALTTSPTSKYQMYVDDISLLYIEALNYKQCGEYDCYRDKIAEIEAVLDEANCDCACCDDDEAKLISNTSASTQSEILQIKQQRQFFVRNGVPTVDEDSSAGYIVGALIEDANTGILYRATDVTVGAAVWEVYYNKSLVIDEQTYRTRLTSSGVLVANVDLIELQAGTVAWGRVSTGRYVGVLVGGFDVDKTYVNVIGNSMSTSGGDNWSYYGKCTSANSIEVQTRDETGALADDILNETFVEVKILP